MRRKDFDPDVIRLLPLAAGLWLVYLLALALIDRIFYPRPVFPPLYYALNGVDALAVLGLALWPAGRRWLGNAFLPLVIGLMSVVPVVSSNMTVLPLPASPAHSPEATMLRLIPVLFLALVLTSWQYRWRQVLLFIAGVDLFVLALHVRAFRPGGEPILPPLTVVLIQTVSFLVVGYFVSVLVARLRRQQESLAEANTRLAHYAATLEDLTISRERNRMARELHDTLAHTLSGLSVQLETIGAYWTVDPDKARLMVNEALAVTRSGLQETRRALKSLRASPVDDLGLALALEKLARDAAARAHLQLDLSLPERMPVLAPDVQQCIYRVTQEAVANVVQHAGAHTLSVRLSVDGQVVSLLVQDDGNGFDLQRAGASGRYGLAGMRERAELAAGRLLVTSRPGQGTGIRLTLEGIGE